MQCAVRQYYGLSPSLGADFSDRSQSEIVETFLTTLKQESCKSRARETNSATVDVPTGNLLNLVQR